MTDLAQSAAELALFELRQCATQFDNAMSAEGFERALADVLAQAVAIPPEPDFQTIEVTDARAPQFQRLTELLSEVELGMNCFLRIGRDPLEDGGKLFIQIACYRLDTITKQMGWGYGGKAYPSEHATDNEILQSAFGLYKGYWEHEARETFILRGRRPFGPHIDTWALWEVARRVDVRSAKHVEDRA